MAEAALDIESIVAHYVRLRDEKKKIEERHKEELAPLNADMTDIEAVLMAVMDEQHVDSVKTKSGTAYTSTVASVSMKNWEPVRERIIRDQLWDLLEARVNKTAYIESGLSLDGVEVTRVRRLNIRRS